MFVCMCVEGSKRALWAEMVQYIYLDNNKTPTWPERQQVMLLLFGAVLLTFQPGISLFLFVASLCVSRNSDSSVCVCICSD